MKRFSRLSANGVRLLLVGMVALWAQLASAQVLEQVPSDAMAVIHMKHLQGINQKMAALAKQWGIVEMNPAMADPLGFALSQSKINEGFDKEGDAAMVIAKGSLDADPPPMILLVPVTDYAKFISNFAGAQKDGDLDKFKMSIGGEEATEETYAANWGHYAALTPTKELLAKKPDGFKPSPAVAKEVSEKDIVAIGNFKVLGPMLKEKIDANKDRVPGEIEQNLGQNEEFSPYVPLLKVLFTQGVTTVENFLTETDCASLSVNLQTDGVGVGFLVDFLADSDMGKVVAATKGTDESLLAGLPAEKYLIVGGGRNDTDTMKQAFDAFLAPIQEQLASGNENQKKIGAYVDAIKSWMHDQKQQTFGLVTPTGALGTPIFQTIVVQRGDSQALIKDQEKMLTSQQDVMAMLPNQAKMKIETKPDAKTVDGISFTQFTTTVEDTSTPAGAAAKQMLTMMYGPNGAVAYGGAVDDQHVLMTAGLDDATISAAIKAVKEKSDPLSKDEGIVAVRKHLPQTKMSEGYIEVGDIVTTAATYAKMFGIPLPISMKAGLPPVGFAVATEGPSIRGDMYVPSDLIEQLVAMALQFNMGGGNKGGGL